MNFFNYSKLTKLLLQEKTNAESLFFELKLIMSSSCSRFLSCRGLYS